MTSAPEWALAARTASRSEQSSTQGPSAESRVRVTVYTAACAGRTAAASESRASAAVRTQRGVERMVFLLLRLAMRGLMQVFLSIFGARVSAMLTTLQAPPSIGGGC